MDHDAQQLLLNAAWAGNIRELENAIEHALAMKSGLVIKPENLPVQIVTEIKQQNKLRRTTDMIGSSSQTATMDYSASSNENRLAETQLKPWQLEEKHRIEKILIQHKGNRIKAASKLGMSRIPFGVR